MATQDNQPELTPQEIEKIAREQAEQGRQFGNQGTDISYSHQGSKEATTDQPIFSEPTTRQEKEEGLYGLASPLATPGEKSQKARDKDQQGTEMSQDENAYQQ